MGWASLLLFSFLFSFLLSVSFSSLFSYLLPLSLISPLTSCLSLISPPPPPLSLFHTCPLTPPPPLPRPPPPPPQRLILTLGQFARASCRRRPATGPARPPFAQPPREGRRPRPNFTSPTQQHRGIPTKGAAHHSPPTCRSWSQRTPAFCQNGNTARPNRPSRGPPGAILGPPLALRGGNFPDLCETNHISRERAGPSRVSGPPGSASGCLSGAPKRPK